MPEQLKCLHSFFPRFVIDGNDNKYRCVKHVQDAELKDLKVTVTCTKRYL